MKTPETYKQLLSQSIITSEMIASVLYSYNKRAKNWRERFPGRYLKAKLARNWILDEDIPAHKKKNVTYRILDYYKKKDYLLITLYTPSMLHLIDDVYYLHYRVHNSEFHLPLTSYNNYGFTINKDLKTKNIDDFSTHGEHIETLLSIRFCDNVVKMIKSGKYVMRDDASGTTYN